jgi:hypothetical protein
MYAERIKIGFHRIGAILAFVTLFIGGLALSFGIYQWAEPLVRAPAFEVSGPDGERFVVRYSTNLKAVGAQVKERYKNQDDRRKVIDLLDPEFARVDAQRDYGALWMLGSLVALVGASALYSACWAVGWVLAGFFGD